MKRIIFLIFIIFSNSLYSQFYFLDSLQGYTYGLAGYHQINISNLNSKLSQYNYSEFPNDFYSLGLGHHKIYKHFVLETEGHYLRGRKVSNENYNQYLMANWIYLDINIGYILIKKNNINIFPYTGVGIANIDFSIYEKPSNNFDSLLNNPGKGLHISKTELLINFGIGFDYFINLSNNANKNYGLIFGLRSGYLYSPYSLNWEFIGLKIEDGPYSSLSGPFIKLLIGIGNI